MSSELPEELVYGTWESGTDYAELIVLPRSVAARVANILEAMGARTWGEVEDIATPAVYADILGRAGYGDFDDYVEHLSVGQPVPGAIDEALRQYAETQGEPLPACEDPFSAEDLPSYADGDFPQSPFGLMYDLLPEPVVMLGSEQETNFNGTYVRFGGDKLSDVIGMLSEAGYRCVEEEALIAALYRD